MKLFSVNSKPVQYFDNKVQAKEYRDSLGGIASGYFVSRGPGNLPSPTGVPRMRRQPK